MESQNTVKYAVYCGEKVSGYIERFCGECQSFCDSLMMDYIWQKEPFILHPIEHKSGLPCLSGSTNFGENVNDEWFIVFLLFELTKKIVDVVAHVSDEDGEFLLIQAADELPKWLKPDTSENRVFIHRGNLHIIPQPSNPGEISIYPSSTPSMSESYKMVVGCFNTESSDNIQKLIHERIKGYPVQINEDFHHANCYLPKEIVYILQNKPSLVANAVQAFYERDPIDVNICSNLKVFQPSSRMIASVKFTKHLYGQLHQAQFLPSKKSQWKLPSHHDGHYKAAYLGYKLTCGFEILLGRSINIDKEEDDLKPSGRLWEQYVSNLKKNDFFQGELEGSKGYVKLLEQARHHFKKSFCSSSRGDGVGKMVAQLVAEANEHMEDIKKSCENIPQEDSDDWLTITSEDLDGMMLKMWGQDKQQVNIDNLSKMVSSVKSFVDNVSSYEGAEIAIDNANNGSDDEINFDPNVFMDCVKKLIDPSQCPTLPADSESDDYDSDSEIDDEFVSCFRDGEVDSELSHMMESMDMELKESTLHKSFTPKNDDKNTCNDVPLDVDINVIQNFVESFSSQDGLAGPVSSILHSMGLNLPPEDDS